MSFRSTNFLLLQLAALSALSLLIILLSVSQAAFAAGVDPTLEPIAADEPIPTATFPPIPDRLNLGSAIAASPASPSAIGGSAPSAAISPSYHQGYGHVPAGAYMPQQRPAQAAPQRAAQSSGNDSYNVNTSQARPQLPELPTPVTVSQSTTQDLSLPDDEFSDYHQKKRRNGIGGNMMRGVLYGAGGMAAGIGMGALRY